MRSAKILARPAKILTDHFAVALAVGWELPLHIGQRRIMLPTSSGPPTPANGAGLAEQLLHQPSATGAEGVGALAIDVFGVA